jgi:trk system potassium uptake protein TrkH
MSDEPRGVRSGPEPRAIVRQGGEVRAGQRAGDRRLRVPGRPQSQRIAVPTLAKPRRTLQHPAATFAASFAGLIAAGTAALSLPIASASGEWTPMLDALFTATSAVCLTGLVVVDTGTHWSGFGHAVLLGLFQIGGFGFMTTSTLLLLLVGYRLGLRERLLLREAIGSSGLASALPLARRVLLFTLAAEVVGALLLTARFLAEKSPPEALWWGVFHAGSAFMNAGFDLVGGGRSLMPFAADPFVLVPVGALMLLGTVSYSTVEDVLRQRRFVRLALDTKLVLSTLAALTLLGALALLFTERANAGTLGGMGLATRVLNALFLSVARTGGFATVDVGRMTEDSLVVLMGMMFVGGAASSTAGGIKLQTFSILLFAIISAVRGVPDVEAFRRRVPTAQVARALSIALLSVAAVFAGFFALNLTESQPFARLLFEVVSAFATVGLSTGITHELSPFGRLIVIVAMFVGRLGPLTLALALAARERRAHYRWPEEGVRIG